MTLLLLSFAFFCSLLISIAHGESVDQYNQARSALVQKEVELSLAGLVTLNTKEVQANNILTDLQAKEISLMGDNFPPAMNFFDGKGWIDNSSIVFPYLRGMPKGAALHQHLDSTGSYYNLVYNISYKYPCYMYEGENQKGAYTGTVDCFDPKFVPSNEWVSLSTLREKNANFDAEWLLNMTLKGRDYGDYIQLWDKFDGVFGEVALLHRKEVMADYLSHMFLELANDGLQYAEYRSPPIVLLDLQNNTYNFSYFVEMFKELSEEANFPGKLIYSVSRSIPADEALIQMRIAIQMINQYPDVVIGFDLDGPEDEGHTLIYFIDQFLQINNESGNTLKYFFHAGETVFLNNTNLYDALLLNSTRIGHGFQLNKHPVLLDEVKAKGICIEVCPISNQILELSPDIRTHPGFEYFNRGIPIVISSDDPSIYGYEGTSYDFYEAFMSWNLDIRGLKQLAINSIECSIWNSDTEKQLVYQQWQTEWAAWIDTIVNDFN